MLGERAPTTQTQKCLDEQIGIPCAPVPPSRHVDDGVQNRGVTQGQRIERVGGDGVLDVMDAVGDVVGQIHHLALHRSGVDGSALLEPPENLHIVGIHAELRAALALGMKGGLLQRPWIFHRGVQSGPGEIHADGTTVIGHDLRLKPGEDAQGLRVALEAADVPGDVGEDAFPVVSEGGMSQIVREARAIDDVGIASQHGSYLAADLRHLKSVGQARAGEVVGPRHKNLAFGAQPSQRG